ncbi:molybdopterin-guanine dinucleotide biosynthesis protein B [Paenibacillus oenotherae]|uniref:Molybdopterin-guanine dinucleotide biosynthesis protein B n=1 Tax=Paenibacillus oenotherae TaxID=1435645 RepID=A0ABS7D999_9BACL|nr:molybdopterin-guanine dinucleotide biosynthesis protein B [Paenibacillus oenotherae]MBW7476519.1 molybdopterin-guanine dinucleotide biosynthesis protein B [Paenibacillus oenotherae]
MYSRNQQARPIVVQIVGYKNSGKTTLVTELIRRFKRDGYTIGTAKHDAHDFAIDTPGTDTWKHQQSGADITAISSSTRSAVLMSRPETLDSLLMHMKDVDLVLVEGFKQEPYPKLVLIRTIEDISLLQDLARVVAAVVWSPQIAQAIHSHPASSSFKTLDLHNPDSIYQFLLANIETSLQP